MANIFNKITAKAENVIDSLSNQPSKVDSSYKEVETEGLKLVLPEGNISVDKMEKFQKVLKIVSTVLIYAFLVVMAVIVLLPFYWMIITSLKTNEEIRATTQTFWPTIVHGYNNCLKASS